MNPLQIKTLHGGQEKVPGKGLCGMQNLVFSSFFHANPLFPTDDKKDQGDSGKQVKPDSRSKGFGDQFKGPE
jgi:hypothetical protein